MENCTQTTSKENYHLFGNAAKEGKYINGPTAIQQTLSQRLRMGHHPMVVLNGNHVVNLTQEFGVVFKSQYSFSVLNQGK